MVTELPVFVVHENTDLRWAIAQILRYEGFEVATFTSLEDFLSSRRPRGPGCVVLGLSEDTQGAQENLIGYLVGSPVIVVCPQAPDDKTLQRLAEGRFEVVTLPTTPEILLSAVRNSAERLH